ncbi:MAG: HAD-IIB family hydrolase [archaeon]|nr:HAD-IIB family hydrolase [archaeon]
MKIVFTDLDGTLLDHNNYSFSNAKPGLAELKKNKIPLIIASSKTRSEIIHWQKKLGITAPFICENGAAIFLPKKYFSFPIPRAKKNLRFDVLAISSGIKKIRTFIKLACKTGIAVEGISEMSIAKVMELTGLGRQDAIRAKRREFEEAIIVGRGRKKFEASAREKGFNLFKGGRFWHIMKGESKGFAVKKLTDLYIKEFGSCTSLGLGDSENDFEMLRSVDCGFLVKKHDGSYSSKKFAHAKGIGPKGWNSAVLAFTKTANGTKNANKNKFLEK